MESGIVGLRYTSVLLLAVGQGGSQLGLDSCTDCCGQKSLLFNAGRVAHILQTIVMVAQRLKQLLLLAYPLVQC